MADFNAMAGQLVAGGAGTLSPIKGLEDTVAAANLSTINGLMPKIGKVHVMPTKVYGDIFAPYTVKTNGDFGAGIETVAFKTGAPNMKRDGSCMPRGQVDVAVQADFINYAYNVNITVKDREVNKGVLTAAEAAAYANEKQKTALKTVNSMKNKSFIQLLSDVVDGTRNIVSTDNSQGTGTAVTYAPTITGYAGKVIDTEFVSPAIAGGETTFVAADAVAMLAKIRANIGAMHFETADYNLLDIETFIEGKALIVMEDATIEAMQVAIDDTTTNVGMPARNVRAELETMGQLVLIPAFAALPTNAAYTGKRVLAVVIDSMGMIDHTVYADLEMQRCAQERANGYNYQGESILAIYRGVSSCAFLGDTS